ncbi:MAG TPA: tRNA pseudouridine(55) synthase TruB [bacterium]|nr:tRNA pseudouridine(55) synthase TruB [bacterium]
MAASGIIVVNKPAGITSRRVTDQVSRLFREKKAGHLGTLDPLASGVLPVALGSATRLIRFLEGGDKVYEAVVRLGTATDTYDAEGRVVSEGEWRGLDPAAVTAAVSTFQGEGYQLPPMHSAIKKDGRRLYDLARQGLEVERAPRRVAVFSVITVAIAPPDVMVRVRCGPGTYIRSIAHDLGLKLGCGAHLASLVRSASGPFTIGEAVDLDTLTPETAALHLIPLDQCLPHFPAVEISTDQAALIRDGVAIPAPEGLPAAPGQMFRLIHNGALAAVAIAANRGYPLVLRPLRVFL